MELLRVSGEVKGKYGYIDSDGIFKETSYGSGAGNNNDNDNNDDDDDDDDDDDLPEALDKRRPSHPYRPPRQPSRQSSS